VSEKIGKETKIRNKKQKNDFFIKRFSKNKKGLKIFKKLKNILVLLLVETIKLSKMPLSGRILLFIPWEVKFLTFFIHSLFI